MANRCSHCLETYSMPALLQPYHKSQTALHQYCRSCFEAVANLIVRSKEGVLLVKCMPCEKYVCVEAQHKDRISSLFEKQVATSRQTAEEIEKHPFATALELSQ